MPPHRSITAIGSAAGCRLLDRSMALPVCRRCLVLFTVQRHAAAALLAPERVAHHRDGLHRHGAWLNASSAQAWLATGAGGTSIGPACAIWRASLVMARSSSITHYRHLRGNYSPIADLHGRLIVLVLRLDRNDAPRRIGKLHHEGPVRPAAFGSVHGLLAATCSQQRSCPVTCMHTRPA